MCEEEIIQALKDGDMSALDTLYEIYGGPGMRTAYLIVSDYYAAEDVVQDTFIQCVNSVHSLKNNTAFKPWFYRILTRLAYKAAKRIRRTVPCEDIYSGASACDKYPSDSEYLYEHIKQLKPKHRAVIVLYYYNDMSIREISTVLRCPEGTVKSRLNTAKNQLRKAILSDEQKERENFYGC